MKHSKVNLCGIFLLTCGALQAGMISPDGKFVAYTVPTYDENAELCNEIVLKATDGSSTRKLARLTGKWDQVAWLENDRLAIGQFAMADHFVVLDITGKRLPDIVLPAGCRPLYMALSPDGQKVAFTGSRHVGGKEPYGVFVCQLKQGEARLLIEKALRTLAGWSPDSSRLAVGTGEGYAKNHPLQIVDIATGKVDDTGALGVGASWSPDGKLIACTTEVQRGGSWFAGVPTDGKLGLFDVEKHKMRVVEGTDGAIQPTWSKTGNYLAYIAGEKIGIVRRDGGKPEKVPPVGENLKDVQMAWVGDNALYLRTKTHLTRFDVATAGLAKVAEWTTPRAPEIKPEDFKTLELPRVTVKYARFDRKYAEAFGKILGEALKVYESLGFKMPAKVTLEAQIDPSRTQLWTDEPDGAGLWLCYDDGTMEDKQSMSGSAETVLFRLPEGSWQLDGIRLFSGRYGEDAPPKEDISIYVCNEAFELLHEVKIPYARFEKGEEKWHSVSFDPVNVPKTFYLGLDFHATATKGVYVGMDKGVKHSHSRIAMPYAYVDDMRATADWMIRPHLSLKK